MVCGGSWKVEGGKVMGKMISGWRPISEYTREKYDWVLVKYFELGSEFECVPVVAEMHRDGKWYTIDDREITGNYQVRYFFDMQQLDNI